ncbi:MAG: GHKL domain-containing protein, partial [Bosea sp.]|uniref:sensor histidine kinase n=1 Tax=Bosea sp. (in: a-proteobacteria) TaxID=1871050 RepID=UPI0023A69EDC|nr:GHKL domain-containing protein [Bosea sp. (in: a-proteobacteria)]
VASDPAAAQRVDRDVGRIDAAAAKMAALLEDLLALSRIGRQSGQLEDVALGEIAREAQEPVAGAIAQGGVEVEIASDLPAVRGDHARLVELVQNLIENAVRYMGDQPAPRIEIEMRETAATPVFFVRDNGIGIDPRYHEKIFGLFERLDPQATEGTGVGLALVQRIVELHGGRIWVESKGEGQGSTFCFTLPAADR